MTVNSDKLCTEHGKHGKQKEIYKKRKQARDATAALAEVLTWDWK